MHCRIRRPEPNPQSPQSLFRCPRQTPPMCKCRRRPGVAVALGVGVDVNVAVGVGLAECVGVGPMTGVGVGVGPAPAIVTAYGTGPVPAGPEPPWQFGIAAGNVSSLIKVSLPIAVKSLASGFGKSGFILYGFVSVKPQ